IFSASSLSFTFFLFTHPPTSDIYSLSLHDALPILGLLCFGCLGFGLFETFFQIAQRLKTMAFVFANPTLVDLMQRHWIEIMQLLTSAPHDRDEVCLFQQDQMLGHRLAGHV